MIRTQRDILAFLESELQAYLDAIATEFSIDIDTWKEIGIGRQRGKQYPSVGIEANTTGEQIIIPGNAGPSVMVRRFDNVNIVVWHRGNNNATRKIEENVTGYMDALSNLFSDKADMDSRSYLMIKITGTEYTDLFPDPASKSQTILLKGAVFTIEVRPNY